jgi:23S rRNA pseudouridine2605 synthase
MADERLQKVLARAGVSSRRKAEAVIAAGRVTVDGIVVTELGAKVDPERDTVAVDGVPIDAEQREYWALHKPVGVITTAKDPWGRPTALELVPSQARVYPVGRLDADSAGLLLLTNDGELAFKLTHPRFEHDKEYHVLVAGRPDAADLRRLRRGILLDGRATAPAEVDVLASAAEGTWLRMVLREGRKRQIRRMMERLHHPVMRLLRVRVGPILLGDLPEGESRRLTPDERAALRELAAQDVGSGSA